MKNLNQALEAAFAEATILYRERGFQRRIGFGSNASAVIMKWNPYPTETAPNQPHCR
jgi:hypothetical protein